MELSQRQGYRHQTGAPLIETRTLGKGCTDLPERLVNVDESHKKRTAHPDTLGAQKRESRDMTLRATYICVTLWLENKYFYQLVHVDKLLYVKLLPSYSSLNSQSYGERFDGDNFFVNR